MSEIIEELQVAWFELWKKIKLAFISYNQEVLARVVTQEGGKKMN